MIELEGEFQRGPAGMLTRSSTWRGPGRLVLTDAGLHASGKRLRPPTAPALIGIAATLVAAAIVRHLAAGWVAAPVLVGVGLTLAIAWPRPLPADQVFPWSAVKNIQVAAAGYVLIRVGYRTPGGILCFKPAGDPHALVAALEQRRG